MQSMRSLFQGQGTRRARQTVNSKLGSECLEVRLALSAAPLEVAPSAVGADAVAEVIPPDILTAPAAASPLAAGQAIGIVRDGVVVETASSDQASDLERGDALRTIFAQARPGDEVVLGPYAFDMGDLAHVEFPANVTVTGAGKELTRLSSGLRQYVDGAATFTLNDQTVLQDLWLEGTLYDGTYQTLVGMGYIPTNDITTTLKRVKITGDSDGIYIWANPDYKYHLYAYDCEISTRYDAVAVLGSNPYQEYVEIWNSTLTVQQPSAIPKHISNAVNIQTGEVKLINCTLNATGDANSVQTAGIFAWNLGRVEVINSTFNVSDPTGTAFDIWMEDSAQVFVSGGQGSGAAGDYTSKTHNEVMVDAANSTIVNRAVFYNNSVFDNRDPAAGVADGNAIASDKTALLPGQTATFANYTSYTRGINGLIIDLAGPHGAISADDFVFKTSLSPQLDGWLAAPVPLSVTILGGEGVGNSERIEIIWSDGAIRNTWLQVTMLANGRTGLATPDVFLFGNLVGDVGGDDGKIAITDALDVNEVLSHISSRVSISNAYDFNRDGLVSSTDMAVAYLFSGSQLLLAEDLGEQAARSILPPSVGTGSEPLLAPPHAGANADTGADSAPLLTADGVRPLLLTAHQPNRFRSAIDDVHAARDVAVLDADWWEAIH
jgi:hypothetical protein